MTKANGRWADLGPRVLSGVIMIALGIGVIVQGGVVFQIAVAAVGGMMVWEMCRLLCPDKPSLGVQGALLQAAVLLVAIYLPPMVKLPILIAPALAIAGQATAYRGLLAVFMGAVSLAGYEMVYLRNIAGFQWLVWLVVIVVVTDVAGYFFGKTLGGPKFWPALSPKKTWSGTAGGWLCSALVGVYFVYAEGIGVWLVPFTMTVAFAAQLGDLAESALKRHVGAKDSSDLIPGHGGLMDRFDGMVGASLYVMVIQSIFGVTLGAG